MKEEEEKAPPTPIVAQLKEYIETRIRLIKYEAIDKSSSIIADIITDIIQIIFVILAIVFASFTLAFFLAQVLGSVWMGFGIVLLLYILALLLIKVFKKGVERPVINIVIRKFFKH